MQLFDDDQSCRDTNGQSALYEQESAENHVLWPFQPESKWGMANLQAVNDVVSTEVKIQGSVKRRFGI